MTYSGPVKAVATGLDTSLALTTNGIPINWGSQAIAIPPGLQGVQSIATGEDFGLALLDNGTVVGWGVEDPDASIIPNGLLNVKAIACGTNFSIALLANGTLVGWGDPSAVGLLGISSITNVKAISAGPEFGMALLDNGTIVGWGDDTYGETTVPTGLGHVSSIACGYDQSLAQLSNGTVTAWGGNTEGESTVPTGLSGVTQVQGGVYFSTALLSNGTVQVWGNASNGPTMVVPPAGFSGCTAISANGWDVLALGPPAVTAISLDNSSIVAGTVSNVTVTVSPVSPTGGENVNISGSGPLTLPTSWEIPAGAGSATFQLQTGSVTTQSPQTITATLNGASETTTLTITPLAVTFVSFSSPAAYEGQLVTCTVGLSAYAPASGASITISGTGPVTLIAGLSVAPGADSGQLLIYNTVRGNRNPSVGDRYAGTKRANAVVQHRAVGDSIDYRLSGHDCGWRVRWIHGLFVRPCRIVG